jgi:hypothetical protein
MSVRSRFVVPCTVALIAGPAVACDTGRAARVEPTAAQRLYGPAPPRDGSITYQPDVVLVGSGPDAIRSFSPDGMTWTVDPTAEGVAALVPGKIMFASARAAGRVLATRETHQGLAVTVGPVALTDVIRDAQVAFEQSLDLSKAVVHEAPNFPGASTAVARSRAPRLLLAAMPAGPASMPALASGSPGAYGRFNVDSIVDAGRIGLSFSSDAGGVSLIGGASLALGAPRLRVELAIAGARVKKASIQLHGAAGLHAWFEAASKSGAGGNFHETVLVPVDFSLFDGVPPPFAVTVRQLFTIHTFFTSPGSLKAKASYGLDGALALSYVDGHFIVGGPVPASKQGPLALIEGDDLRGLAIGANGLVVSHQARVIVGIGALGFTTGPYVGLNSSLGVAHGSSIGISRHPLLPATREACRGAVLDMKVAAGVGYSIPAVVTDSINFFISGLNSVLRTRIAPISGHGGLELKPNWGIYHKTWSQPEMKICRDAMNAGSG